MTDVRRNPRFACSFPAVFHGPRGAVRGTCTNLSLGGLYFQGNSLAVGSNAEVTLDLQSLGKLKLHCEIRHHGSHGMGVQFTRFEPDQAELLQRVLVMLQK